MKILILSDDFPPKSFGGAGVVACNSARALKGRGHSVFVITTVQDVGDEGEIEFEGIKVFRIYSAYHERFRAYLSLYNPQTVRRVRNIINEVRPDIFHAHNIHHHLSYYCLKLAKLSGAKVFLTAHDVMLFHYGKLGGLINKISWWQQFKKYKKRYNPFRNFIIRHYLKYVGKVFAVSNALKELLERHGIKNIEVIYNGIDVEEWRVDSPYLESFSSRYGLAGKKVVLFGGRLSEAKGGHQAVLVMDRVIKEVPQAVLLIVGAKNEYAEVMIQYAKSLGIDRNLVFTGWISGNELKAAYYSSDMLLAPSICFDSFPTVILEAMACKKPVVATCFGGAREIVTDGKTGYIINPFNVILLAGQMTDLLLDSSKAESFGEAGYVRVKDKFSLSNQIDILEKYYDIFKG